MIFFIFCYVVVHIVQWLGIKIIHSIAELSCQIQLIGGAYFVIGNQLLAALKINTLWILPKSNETSLKMLLTLECCLPWHIS